MVEDRMRISSQLIIGCAVVVIGVLFTLDNLNLVDSGSILRWWPVVLVIVGLTRLFGVGSRPQVAAGGLITMAGIWFLLVNLDLLQIGLWDLWPLGLVFTGGWLVLRGVRRSSDAVAQAEPDDYVNAFVMMGAVVRKMNSARFRGGEVTAFMGGVELDLRGVHPATDTIVIDVLAWWGGIELWVPPDWKVSSEVLPIMAGYEDKTKVAADAKTHLIVRGLVVMGGVEVGN